jgi:hypothetical protein
VIAHCATAQRAPPAFGPTLCRRVVHSAAPRVGGSLSEPRPARRGGRGGRRGGDLGTCPSRRACRGFQDFSFSVSRAGTPRTRRGARRGTRGFPTHRPARTRSGRAGRARGAGMAAPMGPARASLGGDSGARPHGSRRALRGAPWLDASVRVRFLAARFVRQTERQIAGGRPRLGGIWTASRNADLR